MQEMKTMDLNNVLKTTTPKQVSGFLKENSNYMKSSDRSFYDYFTDVLKEKRIRLKDVYSFAGVDDSYGGQIIRMEKHTVNRDLIIRLCIAGHFDLDELNRALKLYGMNELYAKEPRDVCLIIAVNNQIYDFGSIDNMLEENGFKKITIDE